MIAIDTFFVIIIIRCAGKASWAWRSFFYNFPPILLYFDTNDVSSINTTWQISFGAYENAVNSIATINDRGTRRNLNNKFFLFVSCVVSSTSFSLFFLFQVVVVSLLFFVFFNNNNNNILL